MTYLVTSRAYLGRMKARMDEGTDEALIYAAFELRCGVEARMQEYVETIDHLPKATRDQWEIAKLRRSLESAYRTGDKTLIYCFEFSDGAQMQLTFFPVMQRLQTIAGMMDDYRHAMKPRRAAQPGWFDRLRDLLKEAYPLLLMATSGELVGLPLVNRETGKFKVKAEIAQGDARHPLLVRLVKGARPRVSIIDIEPTGPITFYER